MKEKGGYVAPKAAANLRQLLAAFWKMLQQLGWVALVGLAFGLGMLLLFAKLTDEVFSSEFNSLDTNILLGLHSWANSWFDAFFIFFTTVGSTIGVSVITVLFTGLLLWRKHFYSVSLVILVILGGGLLNLALKQIFQRTRPALFVGPIAEPSSYSYPSGHAAMAVCLYGVIIFLAFKFLKRNLFRYLVTFLGLSFILLIGLSRIYLGVHYPTDVVAGYLSSGCWLGVILGAGSLRRKIPHPEYKK